MNSNKIYKKDSDYLEEVFQTSPLSVKKLIALWPDLKIEYQVKVLNLIKNDESGSESYFYNQAVEIIKTALNSKNEYIRYLAASLINRTLLRDDQKIRKKIESDKSVLVQNAASEMDWTIGDYAFKDFFSKPHVERLLKVSKLKANGEEVAKVFEEVPDLIKKKKITALEAKEIAYEYVTNKNFIKEVFDEGNVFDGYDQYKRRDDLKKLWELTLILPDLVASPFIEHLPLRTPHLFPAVVSEIYTKYNDKKLQFLLNRNDFWDPDFRLKIIKDESKKDLLIFAGHNLELTNEQFKDFLPKSPEEIEDSRKFFKTLVFSTRLDWTMYKEIEDILSGDTGIGYSDVVFARDKLDAKFKEANESPRNRDIKEQIIKYKIYLYASRLLRNDEEPKLKDFFDYDIELKEEIVKNDLWVTYTNIYNKLYSELEFYDEYYEKLEKQLPSIQALDNEKSNNNSDKNSSQNNKELEEIKNKLDLNIKEFSTSLSALSKDLIEGYQKMKVNFDILSEEINTIKHRELELESKIKQINDSIEIVLMQTKKKGIFR
jgi:hypothetical protein